MTLEERDELGRGVLPYGHGGADVDKNVDVEPPLGAGSHDRRQDAGVAEVLDRGLGVQGKVALRRMPLLQRTQGPAELKRPWQRARPAERDR